MTRVIPLENRRNLRLDQLDENIEDIKLIWLDQNIDDSAGNKLTQPLLCELNDDVRFYTDIHLCIDHITTIIDEKAFFNCFWFTRKSDILKLYGGQMMFTNKFNELKENIGNLISTNDFLSTSRLLTVTM
ncbi:unnamed protein product [Rotaria sordida]|uniref:Uncharacterized protein n=1 Tax=Rotaria sordida TaxID=392033 RepID=A0A819CRV9_9BILA|nr:unnamed protein product [Rotaria sordida]CAF0850716.1 unnamed protein product [Rotaria sordida]CAF3619544.1 unnamed protein product [Rotaria sordida]CAF3817092.1 unnamed protein product [Rotaria sordida]